MRAKKLIVLSMALAAGAFVTVSAHAGGHRGGASSSAPGQQMQEPTTPTGHGASEYTPGDQMRDQRSSTTTTTTATGGTSEPGASGFAPGDKISKGKK